MYSTEQLSRTMTNAITQLPETLREQLILTKNEQSFSGLWVLEFEKTLSNYGSNFLLLENKGVSFRRNTGKGSKTTMNFHDISLVDSSGNFLMIIENKIWYHFDGAKGSKTPKLEPNVKRQIKADISKIKITLKQNKVSAQGYLLINLVTPSNTKLLPKSYLKSHNTAISRTNNDIDTYIAEGVEGVENHLAQDLGIAQLAHCNLVFGEGDNRSFLDSFCVRVDL